MLRLLSQRTGTCFQRCVGFDAMNALYSVTYEMDQKQGGDYHRGSAPSWKRVQEHDLLSPAP